MNLIDNLKWRYATKQFNSEKAVTNTDLEFLKEAIQLSVSSYGLQLYKVLIVQNHEIRKKLRLASWDQSQITDASHLFIFCRQTGDYNQYVDEYIQRVVKTQHPLNEKNLLKYGESIKHSIENMTFEDRKSWTEKQTYLALNNLLIACSEKQIDACPMEGFDKKAYDRILGLEKKNLSASVVAPVGYRSIKDSTANRTKVRKPIQELFETI